MKVSHWAVIFIYVILVAYFGVCETKPNRLKLTKVGRSLKLGKKSKGGLTGKDSGKKNPFISFTADKDKWCSRVDRTLRLKNMAQRHIQRAVAGLEGDKHMPSEERHFHIGRFLILQKELNETEQQVVESLNWLNDVLRGDYKDVINMKLSSLKRLEALRDATLKEEQEYTAIAKAEEKIKQFNQSKVEGMLAEILRDVSDAANKLEADLDEHVFDNAMQDPNLAKGANVEAVIRMAGDNLEPTNLGRENQSGGRREAGALGSEGGIIKLVDSHDNQFVLAKGKDTTVPHEDPHFIQDVVFLLLLSFVCGTFCTLIGLPSMFGYILGGIVLGPSGLNCLKSLVQLETLGEFGVFFILFSVGLEFSPEKIKKVARVACAATLGMTVLTVLGGLGLGSALKAEPAESVFVAACLSLSSTPLVVRFLSPPADNPATEGPGSSEYGVTLLGILIMQDVLLGLLMALLPNMAATPADENAGSQALIYLLLGLRLCGALLVIVCGCWIVSRFLLKHVFKFILSRGNKEIMALASVALAFLMLKITDHLRVSMELGCFLAGVMLSAQGPSLSEQVEQLIEPLRDFLGVLFFASIGLHVFPSFMAYELTYLMTFTIFTVTAKFVISVVVMAVLLPRSARHVKWLVAAGLAQVSEFSFVLGSRARRLGLISREVYLLILSVTTLSLLAAPLLWRMSLWQLRIKQHSRSRGASRSVSSWLCPPSPAAPSRKPPLPPPDGGPECTCDWKNSPCHGCHGRPASRNGSLCNLLAADDLLPSGNLTSSYSSSTGISSHQTKLTRRNPYHGLYQSVGVSRDSRQGTRHSHEDLYVESHLVDMDDISTPDLLVREGRRVSC